MQGLVSVMLLAALLSTSLAGRSVLASGLDWGSYRSKPDAWYAGEEGARLTANILSHQSSRGDWAKNLDTSVSRFAGDPTRIHGTFDNGATLGEVRFLARAFQATGNDACRDAETRAIDQILRAQYPSGGWPQHYPPGPQYHRRITFNDGTMVNLARLMRDVGTSPDFAFVDAVRRERARAAFDAAITCILKCQIKVGGVKTVWCAQHDEVTLEPRPGRSFEPVSLSGAESAEVLTLLMSLPDPSPEVVEAIDSALQWFQRVKLTGIRQISVNGDKRIVADKEAPPVWARFYEIGSDRPIFSGRDGHIQYELASIEPERRNGYAWYGAWGKALPAHYRPLPQPTPAGNR
jgi:pectate lyase